MEILFATHADTDALRDMWKTCFGDSDSYINAYFENVYRPENTIIAREGGTPIGSLQMIPHRMYIEGCARRVVYIGGVCVLPPYRNRGIASRLMAFSENHMKANGVDLAFLVPFSFAFYEKLGYRAISFLSEYTGETAALAPFSKHDMVPSETATAPTAAYRAYASRFPVFLERDTVRFEKEILPLSERARLFSLWGDAGYFLANFGEVCDVLAISYKDEEALRNLLGCIQNSSCQRFRIRTAADGALRKILCENTITETRYPHAMAKVFSDISLPCSFQNYINMIGWF